MTDKTPRLIELPTEILGMLSAKAAAMGLSVKRLMEHLLISSVDYPDDDEEIYNSLLGVENCKE